MMANRSDTRQDEPDLNRRSKRNTPFLGPQFRRKGAKEPFSRKKAGNSPAPSDGENKKRTGPQRRRIQVACKRCRRRKIKCSGDPGDGQGCSNCKNSGTPDCQFLRVNSSELQPRSSYPSWLYSASSTPSLLGSTYGNSQQPASKGATLSTLQATSSSLRQPNYGLGTHAERRSSTRNSFAGSVRGDYESDSMAAQSMQSPAYLLPHSNSSAMQRYCEYPDITRLSYSSPTFTRAQVGTLYPDHDLLSPLAQTEYSYPEPSHASLSADIPPLFPALESLSSGQGYDRTLPDPTSRSQLSTNSMATASSSEIPPSSSSHFPSEINGKSRNRWLSQNEASPRSQASTRTISSVTGIVNPMDHMKAASTAHDVIFKYMTMGSSVPPPPVASDTFSEDRANTADDYRTHADTELTRSLSRDDDSLLSVESCSPQMYGYSTNENSGRRSRMEASPSSATLVNGLQYTRVRRPDNPSLLPYGLVHSETALDFRAPSDIHKTSIPSVSNTTGC
ncbi:transcriptional regulator family: Fungal Specific TF [Paecilomyces variotii]|nr:transcriptional regulator family: Fungal Specific TF [Paecilomyces variotii]